MPFICLAALCGLLATASGKMPLVFEFEVNGEKVTGTISVSASQGFSEFGYSLSGFESLGSHVCVRELIP